MAQHVVAHLVGHHDQELGLVELGDQGVPEDDPLGVEHAGHVGVDGLGVDALVRPRRPGFPRSPPGSARSRIDCSSALSFIGPNLLKRGSIQIGLTSTPRTGTGPREASCRATTGAGCAQAEDRAPRPGRTRPPSPRPGRERVAQPLGERLVREPVGVLADEALVISQRQIDHEHDREVHDDIEADREEPAAAQPLRQVSEPGRERPRTPALPARARPRPG